MKETLTIKQQNALKEIMQFISHRETSSPWAMTRSWQGSCINAMTDKPSKLGQIDVVRGL